MRFTHLRVHSEYSLLESACRVQTLVSRAKQLGFDSLALTDKNVMYGTIPFYKACQQAQIKPIIGLEAQVLTGAEGAGKSYPLILLAKDATGYRHLVNISNHLNMNRKKTAIDIHTLQTYSANLFALSGGAEGEIGQCLLHEEWGYAQSLTAQFAQIFEEGHFFLEVGEHGTREGQKLNNLVIL